VRLFLCANLHAHVAAIIILAFALASGVLLVILSCALYKNWWPLFVGTVIITQSSERQS